MKKYVKASEEDIRHQLKDEGVINPEDYKNEEDSIIVRFNYPIDGFYYGMIDVVMDSDEVGDIESLFAIVTPYLYDHRKELDCSVVYDTSDIAKMMTEDGFDYNNDDDYYEWVSQADLYDDGNGEYLDMSYVGALYGSVSDFLSRNTSDFDTFFQ